jgi:hypothetical protein
LALDDDTFKDMAAVYPRLAPLRELRSTLSTMRSLKLPIGVDGRNRCMLSAFGSTTGRNQPSTTRFVFGLSSWLRGLIRPQPGFGLAYIRSGGTPDRSNAEFWGGTIPWVKTGQIDFNVIQSAEEFITPAGLENSAARMFPAGTILMAMYGQGVTRGRVAILGIDATTNQACAAIEVTSAEIDRDFLYWSLAGKYEELRAMSESRGGNQSNLNAQLIREVKLSLPDLPTQRTIVAEIEAEQDLVASNRELIHRMEAKVKAAIDRVWGEAS